MRQVTVQRYVTPLREGGSLPALVEGDDLGLYVLKFRGAGQGPMALVAEIIGGGIARALAEADLPTRANAMKLLDEHEMGELFKVIGLATPGHGPALGFAAGDRSHRL